MKKRRTKNQFTARFARDAENAESTAFSFAAETPAKEKRLVFHLFSEPKLSPNPAISLDTHFEMQLESNFVHVKVCFPFSAASAEKGMLFFANFAALR